MKNELLFCKTKHCNRNRKGLSAYCGTHNARKTAYGSDTGKRFYPKDYESQAMKVTQLLNANAKHLGVLKAIAFFDDWIRVACSRGGTPGQKHILRLNDEGVTGLELLTDCAALWLLSIEEPWEFDQNALTYALGLAVLTKSRSMKRGCVSARDVRMTDRRIVGKYIQDHIGLMLANICSTIRQSQKEAEQDRKTMSEPLTPQIVNY